MSNWTSNGDYAPDYPPAVRDSESWLDLAARAEAEGHTYVASELLDEAVRAEALEAQERDDAREHLQLMV